MDKIFTYPFAKDGDRNTDIPEANAQDNSVSMQSGWTLPYELNPANGGKYIERKDMNEILFRAFNGINQVAEAVDKWAQLTTENLNDIKQAGRYYQNSNINATNNRNYPVNSAGYLITLNNDIAYYGVTQIYKVWDSEKIFIRRTTSSSDWSAWDSLILTTELNSAVTQLQNAINTKENKTQYSLIDLRNTNLNSVVARGYYQLIYNANNTNIPFTEAGFLFVYNYGENTVKQIAIGANNPNNAIYTRFLHNGVWSNWNRFITNTEADATYRKIADSYTKTETNNLLNQKEDKTHYSLSYNPTLNAVKDNRLYSHGTNYTNAFNTQSNYIFNIGAENGDWVRQISFPCASNEIGVRRIQTKNNMNSWGAWDSLMLTSAANSTFRKIADSYTKAQCDSTFLTKTLASSTYRTIADSYTKSETQSVVGNIIQMHFGQNINLVNHYNKATIAIVAVVRIVNMSEYAEAVNIQLQNTSTGEKSTIFSYYTTTAKDATGYVYARFNIKNTTNFNIKIVKLSGTGDIKDGFFICQFY